MARWARFTGIVAWSNLSPLSFSSLLLTSTDHRITESRRQRRSLLAMGQALREEAAKKTNMTSASQLALHTSTSPHDLIHVLDQASEISLSNNAPHKDDDALFDLDLWGGDVVVATWWESSSSTAVHVYTDMHMPILCYDLVGRTDENTIKTKGIRTPMKTKKRNKQTTHTAVWLLLLWKYYCTCVCKYNFGCTNWITRESCYCTKKYINLEENNSSLKQSS